MKPDVLLLRILEGQVSNVHFEDLVRLGIDGLVNLQIVRGQAKRYQVRQVAGIVRRYDLSLEKNR